MTAGINHGVLIGRSNSVNVNAVYTDSETNADNPKLDDIGNISAASYTKRNFLPAIKASRQTL